MKVTGFNHAALNVHAKLDETIAFYTGLLGMGQLERNPMAARVKGAWFDGSNAHIHVADEEWNGKPRSPIGPHVSLWVDDIIAARAELEAAGVKLFVIGEDLLQVIWFSDPAGNTLEIQHDSRNNAEVSNGASQEVNR
jgi:catechol 2,3-dioxygenase-like lactoylglutathione lyase family enzyme